MSRLCHSFNLAWLLGLLVIPFSATRIVAQEDTAQESSGRMLDTSEIFGELLIAGVAQGDKDKVHQALAMGADIEYVGTLGRTPLFFATEAKMVELLLQHGASATARDASGNQPLHVIVAKGTVAATRALVEHGVEVNSLNGIGQTPLNHAIAWGRLETSEFLLSQGADFLHFGEFIGTPMQQCQERLQNLSSLSKTLADSVKSWEESGKPPLTLQQAVKLQRPAAVQSLLAKGAVVNHQEVSGHTPLHWAARNGDLTCVRFLLEAGANPNLVTRKGLTPLHFCIAKPNETEVVSALLDAGADPRIEDTQGRTVLEWARERKAMPETMDRLRAATDGDGPE